MILSYRHRLIFIHCRKCAGSSIAVSLSRYLGPEDIQLSALTETLAEGIAPPERTMREARAAARGTLPAYRLGGPRAWRRAVSRFANRPYRTALGPKPQHPPFARLEAAFPEEVATFRKIAVTRNPWDKTVSDYFWRIKGVRSPPDFNAYVRALRDGNELGGIVPLGIHDNWPMFTRNGEIAADAVVRFDDLSEGLARALAPTGIGWDGWLPRSKSGTRRAAGHRELYDEETRGIVATLYAPEIEAFGYRF